MASPDSSTRPQTEEMVIVHNVFRSNLEALPDLIRAVADGDRGRAAVLTGWLTELITGLHHHHTGEDELMWPLLTSRAPADNALVLRMEEQHARIADLVSVVHAQATAFTTSGSRSAGASLAASITELNGVLAEHLGEEEARILPIVEQVMTPAEWKVLADRGNASIPKDRRLTFLGFMLYTASDSQRTLLMSQLPAPARVMWRLIGKRSFAKAYQEIYGVAPAWR
ncbi:hemerythrin domain-containing protein [Gordonia sp. TBRC 11910]|uniref:Hemerythrin domain-containing protein n=1 Tax=Gordonia asplenii TaxID=2725283 RepID=A0A848KYM4_9ACTN|nr:hemerythrin domain-containing protein [Gordonia asplenii]NMO01311.1 hemerythrin domain-containing protein [Gordonia asplenii]